jgi:hypothetical protein
MCAAGGYVCGSAYVAGGPLSEQMWGPVERVKEALFYVKTPAFMFVRWT